MANFGIMILVASYNNIISVYLVYSYVFADSHREFGFSESVPVAMIIVILLLRMLLLYLELSIAMKYDGRLSS